MRTKLIGFGIFAALVIVVGIGANRIKTSPNTTLSAETVPPTELGINDHATSVVRIGNKTFNVELALTLDQQSLGLGGRDSLAKNSGMLFVFKPASIANFWMKDMRFNLDLVWVSDGKIIEITRNAPAPKTGTKTEDLPTFSPNVPVDYVLEINSGSADGIKIGDRVEIADSSQV
ncbi:MAG: DUF192 domain-containing protein [Patescibacteria group bacterium]